MQRDEAARRLSAIIGQDIRQIAEKHGITVFHWDSGKLNKGWAGQALTRYLGLPLDSSQSPDGGDWELKVIPLVRGRIGEWKPKETMAITMIDGEDVMAKSFEESHLFAKLRRLVICGREFVDRNESYSPLLRVDKFDLEDPEDRRLLEQIESDYREVREAIKTGGFHSLTGRMGVLVQPRTKGPGHGSTSRAFYARTTLIRKLLKLP